MKVIATISLWAFLGSASSEPPDPRAPPPVESAVATPYPESLALPPHSMSDPFDPRFAGLPERGGNRVKRPPDPYFRGTAVIATSALMLAAGAGMQTFITILGFVAAGCRSDDDQSEHCSDLALGTGVLTFIVWKPVEMGMLAPAALFSTGLAMRGRWQAYQDVHVHGRRPRRLAHRATLGWSLVGAGVGLWAVSLASLACPDINCMAITHGILDTAGTALVGTGLAFGPYATGYEWGLRHDRKAMLTPITIRGGVGLSLAGRF